MRAQRWILARKRTCHESAHGANLDGAGRWPPAFTSEDVRLSALVGFDSRGRAQRHQEGARIKQHLLPHRRQRDLAAVAHR
ncbi:MAG: hypothetical protein AW07_02634 [Candidatus Accumulibacter sp. SK-11]|nr:MAG: hypothetical protein AW07_02634 [Candidatus Accumulibacter sp. SK-11]